MANDEESLLRATYTLTPQRVHFGERPALWHESSAIFRAIPGVHNPETKRRLTLCSGVY